MKGCAVKIVSSGARGRSLETKNSEPRTIYARLFTRQSGMTLVELTLMVIIIGVLSAVVIPKLGVTSLSVTSAGGAAWMIASDIRYVQECAMANRVSKRVVFTSGQSVYTFPPTVPSTTDLDPSGRLPSGVTISGNFTITFNSLGEPTVGGGGSVTVSSGGQTKTITVSNYTGKVTIS
jgi:type II secretory pathway pseudopilin PulG